MKLVAGRRDDVVRGDDVRVAQPRGHLGLAQEALLHVLELRGLGEGLQADPLDRDVPPQHAVVRAVHLAEGARAQPRDGPVALAEQARRASRSPAPGRGPRES